MGSLALVLGAITLPCYAQDSTQSQTKRDENEVLDLLEKNPATALDVALLGLRQTEIVAFIVGKPEIFRRDVLNYFEVSYSGAPDRTVLVDIGYKSAISDTEALVAECKDTLGIAISSLVRDVPDPVSALVGSDDSKSLKCKANGYFQSDTIPRVQQLQITSAGWNICDSIRVVVNVRHGDTGVLCRKDLSDKDIVVIRR